MKTITAHVHQPRLRELSLLTETPRADRVHMLPISVVIPTRNSMSLLPAHLDSMRSWIDLAQEVIVVDSESTDGTVELLKKNLNGKARFLPHPPGLYQSWNHGIRHATGRYVYVSTVGDSMTREGLQHLFDVSEQFGSDVVVSPPTFINEVGRSIRSNNWPVHDIVSYLELDEPICLDGFLTFIFALSFLPFAILGNSAGNLYRTGIVRDNPFPTGYGGNGDGAWGVENGLKIRFAITPKRTSSFRKHRKPYKRSELKAAHGDQRMMESGLRLVEEMLIARPELRAQAERCGLERFIRAKLVVQHWRTKLIWHRSLPLRLLWVGNPFAWRARIHRNAAQKVCQAMFKELLASCLGREPRPAVPVLRLARE